MGADLGMPQQGADILLTSDDDILTHKAELALLGVRAMRPLIGLLNSSHVSVRSISISSRDIYLYHLHL